MQKYLSLFRCVTTTFLLAWASLAFGQNALLRDFSCLDAGSTDTYACSLAVSPGAYATGQRYLLKANTANTGAATINFNSLGAKTIVKLAGGITTALADNDIRAGQWITLIYDGTNMQMLSQIGNAASGSGDALVANPLSQFASTTSAQLAGVVSDETGSSLLVYNTSPTLVTPILGVASATSLSTTGTAGGGFVTLLTQSSAPAAPASGYREFADATGRKAWIRAADGFIRTWDATLTADRVYTLPDVTGTVALTSQVLALTGGTLTGQLVLDNLGIEGEESDTNPTCAAGNYNIYADLSEAKWKKCTDGVVSDLGGAAGTGDVVGPASSTDNQIARYSSTTGKLLDAVAPLTVGDLGELQWTDAILDRFAANRMIMRNGGTSQELMIANSYTSTSVFEALQFRWSADVAQIRTVHTGGSARNMAFLYSNGTTVALQIPSLVTSSIDMASTAGSTAVANGLVRIANATRSMTSGLDVALNLVPTWSTSSTASTVGISLRVAPTINYTNGTPGSGSYEAIRIAVTETALQTGANYLIRAMAGSGGATEKFTVTNAGVVDAAGGYEVGANVGVTVTCSAMPTAMTITGGIITSVTGGTCS